MLEKIISGGQTDSDQAAWRAARAFVIDTGGWMPAGFLTEDGPRPDLADLYGAAELPGAGYPERTAANVRDSDATLWFGDQSSPGGAWTRQECWKHSRSFLPVEPGGPALPSQVAAWLASMRVKTLNVAGNRESRGSGRADPRCRAAPAGARRGRRLILQL